LIHFYKRETEIKKKVKAGGDFQLPIAQINV